MSITKNWMKEDNLDKMTGDRGRRARQRALRQCVSTACFMEGRRKIVGAGFQKAKEHMTEEERTAIEGIREFPDVWPPR